MMGGLYASIFLPFKKDGEVMVIVGKETDIRKIK